MIEFDLNNLIRENIKQLKPYSTARHEFKGNAIIMLDANENAHGSPVQLNINQDHWPLHRYPDPLQYALKKRIGEIKGLPVENIFTGNGSDEAIDLLIRIFCEPKEDNIIVLPPTYGMYEVAASVNNVSVKKVPLNEEFQLNIQAIADAIDDFTKIIFICSPNNPSGNHIHREDIEIILNNFDGIVVIDEAYINYSRYKTFSLQLQDYPNLVVLQTFSKAWGLAALRIGTAFAGKEIIQLMNNIKYPYNINKATEQLALQALANVGNINNWINDTIEQRNYLKGELEKLPIIEKVFPSEANFLLVRVTPANELFRYLTQFGIIVRNRSAEPGCKNCLRITVGTSKENEQLINRIKQFNEQR